MKSYFFSYFKNIHTERKNLHYFLGCFCLFFLNLFDFFFLVFFSLFFCIFAFDFWGMVCGRGLFYLIDVVKHTKNKVITSKCRGFFFVDAEN